MRKDTPYRIARAFWERGYLLDVLNQHNGHVPRAAKATGIGRTQLYRLLERHGIRVPIPRKANS